jgi:DNA gyrase subunit A
LLCFTNKGQCYWLKVYRIPQAGRTSPGRSIANVLSLREEEKITSIVPVREFAEDQYLVMATRQGTVKKTELMAYSNVRQGGIIGISLEDGDELIQVALTKPGDEVVLSTRKGMAIRFRESDARAMGRNAKGVRGIKLGKDDVIVGMVVADPDGLLLTVCENGLGKRTPFGPNTPLPEGATEGDEGADAEPEVVEPSETEGSDVEGESDPSSMRYRLQRRGGKGLKDVKVTNKNGPVVGITSVRDGDEIMLITKDGMVTRSRVDDIRTVGRNTQGVKVMNLTPGDLVVDVARIVKEEDDDDTAAEDDGDETPPSAKGTKAAKPRPKPKKKR